MSAESEEVVVPTDRVQTQQVRPDHGNGLFDFILRCFICMRGIGRPIRCRQCLAIQLAVRGQGQRVQLYVGGWQHVVGQTHAELGTHGLGAEHDAVDITDQIGDQSRFAQIVLAQHHRGVLHAHASTQRGADLAQFDAEST